MSDTSANPAAAAAAPTPKKSGAMKWVVIGVVLLLVLGGAGGAAWWFTRPAPTDEAADGEGSQPPPKKAPQPTGDGIVALDQFLVNLADKDATRFVRVKLCLVVGTKKEADEIAKNEVAKMRLRSAVLELLAQQTSDKLVTPEGKTELKKAIAQRAKPALGETKVLDVLFTDFVVQF
jgi:flagellar FliL protein